MNTRHYPFGIRIAALCSLFALSACGGSGDGGVVLNPDVGSEMNSTISGLSVSETALYFGEGALNEKEQLSLTLINTSAEALTLSASLEGGSIFRLFDPTAQAEVSTLDTISLEPGTATNIYIRYLRWGKGRHIDTLTLSSGTDSAQISIDGTSDGLTPLNRESLFIVPASSHCDGIRANQELDLGEVADGATATTRLKLCNTGERDFYIDSISAGKRTTVAEYLLDHLPIARAWATSLSRTLSLSPDDVAKFVSFTDGDGNTLAFPLMVPAKGHALLTAALKPDLSGVLSAGETASPFSVWTALRVSTLSKNTSTVLRATILPNGPRLYLNGQLPTAPLALQFADAILPEDSVDNQTETNPTRRLTLENRGTSPLQVTAIAIENDARHAFAFSSLPALPFTIAANASQSVDLVYTASGTLDTATLAVTADSLPGGKAAVSLIGNSSRLYLAQWAYRSLPFASFIDSGFLDMGTVRFKGVSQKVFRVKNNSTRSGNTLLSTLTLSDLEGEGISLGYAIGDAPSRPLALGTPISVALSPGEEKTVSIFFTTPEEATALLEQSLSGHIHIENTLSAGNLDNRYDFDIAIRPSLSTGGGGEPLEYAQNITLELHNFIMLIYTQAGIGIQNIWTLPDFINKAWKASLVSLDDGVIETDLVESGPSGEAGNIIDILTTKFSCFDCDNKLPGAMDQALLDEDTNHYIPLNGDNCFDFEHEGIRYCVDPIDFATAKDPKTLGCSAECTKMMTNDEYTALRKDILVYDKDEWNAYTYKPEISYFYATFPDATAEYTYDPVSDETHVSFKDLVINLMLGPNGESYGAQGGRGGLIAGQGFDEDLAITATTHTITDLSDPKDDLIADAIQAEISAKSAELLDQNDLAQFAADPNVNAYIISKDGKYYYSGSSVDWSANKGNGCFRILGYTFIKKGAKTAWFMADSPVVIGLNVCFGDQAASEGE